MTDSVISPVIQSHLIRKSASEQISQSFEKSILISTFHSSILNPLLAPIRETILNK